MVDVIVGVILMLLGIVTYREAGFFPKGQTVEVQPGFYPQILAIVIFLFGLLLLLQSRHKIVKSSLSLKFTRDEIRPFLLIIILIAYLITFNFLGFIISTLLFILCVTLFLKGSFKNAIICSVVLVTSLYIIFKIAFKTPLPDGILNLFL